MLIGRARDEGSCYVYGSGGLAFHAADTGIWLPFRAFRPDCLMTKSGESILGLLASQSDLVVVQDADMRPTDVTTHFQAAGLEGLAVRDTTRLAGLRRHFSYVIAKRSDPVLQHIGGQRLW